MKEMLNIFFKKTIRLRLIIFQGKAGLKVYFWLWEHLCDQV